MKFRYYITDLYDGVIKGTNDEEIAKDYARTEDYFVVDTETNEWIITDLVRIQVKDVDEN